MHYRHIPVHQLFCTSDMPGQNNSYLKVYQEDHLNYLHWWTCKGPKQNDQMSQSNPIGSWIWLFSSLQQSILRLPNEMEFVDLWKKFPSTFMSILKSFKPILCFSLMCKLCEVLDLNLPLRGNWFIWKCLQPKWMRLMEAVVTRCIFTVLGICIKIGQMLKQSART